MILEITGFGIKKFQPFLYLISVGIFFSKKIGEVQVYSILFLPCSRKFFHCSNTFHKKLLGVLKETVQGKAIKQDLINLIFFDVQ